MGVAIRYPFLFILMTDSVIFVIFVERSYLMEMCYIEIHKG